MRGEDNDRHDEDNEPCSTGRGGLSPVTAPKRPPPPLQGVTIKKSQPEPSPLRMALSSQTPHLSSTTPILTASLNRPPVTVIGPTGIDLSKYPTNSSSRKTSTSQQQAQQQQQHVDSRQTIPAELYASLLMQLRRASDVASAVSDASPAYKLTAAARKERLKCQPCFQCPICKKRFQRHIAMNAHFQNEHIGQTSNDADKKICRLCSHVSVDIIAVRQHLLKHHNIDLENPSACLVEPEPTSSTSPFNGDLIISCRSGSSPVTISESSVDLISSSSLSPDRTTPVTISMLKVEPVEDRLDEQEQAKDLSIRGQQQQQPEMPRVQDRKREASPSPVRTVKKVFKKHNNNSNDSDPNWQCQHCNITFPNQTLYFLHKGFHSDVNPWRCNGCGLTCSDMYDFNTHLVSDPHR